MTDELIQDLEFEKNLMPKLHEEYNQNKMLNAFDMEKIRKHRNEGGFGIFGWEGLALRGRLENTVKRGWIEKVDGGKYQLTEKGLGWEESWSV